MSARGVGLQLNPTIISEIGLDKMEGAVRYDFAELLCDSFAGPLDSAIVVQPELRGLLEELGDRTPLVAHGNYGGEFGFEPLSETPAVMRHVAVTKEMKSPWYADHLFFGDVSSAYMWSSPLQFSKANVERVAGRAAQLQDILQRPLLHENAFYYAEFPGSELPEAEFISRLIEKAQTYSLLDLHNVYSNSVNFPEYDPWKFLEAMPLDRVVEIHLAGGQWMDDWYHDFHNQAVPEPVWEMLEYVLQRSKSLEAITLEVQGTAHSPRALAASDDWVSMIGTDLDRARKLWDQYKT